MLVEYGVKNCWLAEVKPPTAPPVTGLTLDVTGVTGGTSPNPEELFDWLEGD